MSSEDLDFHKQWSSKAGEFGALQRCSAEAVDIAGRYFVAGNDRMAGAFRDFANKIKIWESRASGELQAFIEASQKEAAKA